MGDTVLREMTPKPIIFQLFKTINYVQMSINYGNIKN